VTRLHHHGHNLIQEKPKGLQVRLNNNRMERYHGTFKERNKVMRNLKNTDTPILDGESTTTIFDHTKA
jgi:transposase-like protein